MSIIKGNEEDYHELYYRKDQLWNDGTISGQPWKI